MQITDVLPLFPKLFVIGNLETQTLDKELIDSNIQKSSGGLFGRTNGDLHTKEEFNFLTEDIIKFVKKCFSDVYFYKDVEPYITMMWVTKSGEGDYIHRHYHPNSFMSGVYYPFESDYSPIKFYNPTRRIIEPNISEMTVFNSNNMIFKPNYKDIFLFPSDLEHETMPNHLDSPRYSISFNIFLRGNFGRFEDLAYIQL